MASVSSLSRAVSSISVVSVPLDEVAMGDGSAMSLGLFVASGEEYVGGWRWLERSEDLKVQLRVHRDVEDQHTWGGVWAIQSVVARWESPSMG